MNPGYSIAILAAAVFGTADFLGGWASRRVSAITVTFASAAAGLIALLLAMPLVPGSPLPGDGAWAAGAGLCGALGVALLYRAFAIGPVSVAAPVISLTALSVPVIVGLMLGERPSALAAAGMLLTACAIPLLSNASSPAAEPAVPGPGAGALGPEAAPRPVPAGVLPISFASGILVGGFLVLLGRVSAGAGLAPLVVARIAGVTLFAAILAVRRQSPWPAAAPLATVAAGLFDTFANVLYFVAVHRAALSIVGTIMSLAPAATVLLARVVLKERWSASQRLGLACSLAALLCVSLG